MSRPASRPLAIALLVAGADFQVAFVLVGTVALVSVVDFLGLHYQAGAIVSGHQKV